MRDGWVETTLGELAEITTGSRAKGGAITSGIPSIGGEQIAEEGWLLEIQHSSRS